MQKPLGHKSYGSIPHFPSSRVGPGDHHAQEGQVRIATESARDKNDLIIVQEKLDGSNCAVAKKNGEILALGRAGYLAQSSSYEQHQLFAFWVRKNEAMFSSILKENERIVGEWMAQAHGTVYKWTGEPLVVFDIMTGPERLPYHEVIKRVGEYLPVPHELHYGGPVSVPKILAILGKHGHHGAIDLAEGAVWRVERLKPTGRKGEKKHLVDFLIKYVRPEKIDGKYLPELTGKTPVWHWRPNR